LDNVVLDGKAIEIQAVGAQVQAPKSAAMGHRFLHRNHRSGVSAQAKTPSLFLII